MLIFLSASALVFLAERKKTPVTLRPAYTKVVWRGGLGIS